ncbi:MAG TPA: hypothetical protein VGJ69_13040 [Pyrinomonadaceae bacterium]|jgi:hypothetical protein
MPSNKKYWRLSTCAILLSAVAVLGGVDLIRGRINRTVIAKRASVIPARSAEASFQGNVSTNLVGAERITLRATGFEPSEITRPPAPFLLAVDNITGMGDMSFRLLQRNGLQLRDFPANRKFRLRQIIELPPGQYSLVVVDHPDWVCHITIAL